MDLLLDFLDSVLPGPEEASLLANSTKITMLIQIFNSAPFPPLASFFFLVTDNTKTQLFYDFHYLATLILSGGYGFCKI
jgi:hypothetical protein